MVDAIINSVVRGSPAGDVFKELLDEIRSDKRVEALGVEAILKKANDAHEAVREQVDLINGWPAADYVQNREFVEGLMKEFDAMFSQLLDFHAGMMLIRKDVKAKETAANRKRRDKRKAFELALVDAGAPANFVSVIGGLRDELGDDQFLKVFARWAFNMDLQPSSTFDRPLLLGDYAVAPPTGYHSELPRVLHELKDEANTETDKAVAKLPKATVQQCCKPLMTHVTLQHNVDCQTTESVDAGSSKFDIKGSFLPLLTVQANGLMDLDYAVHPCPGIARWISCTRGYAMILFLDIQEMISSGFGLDTVPQYIEKLGDLCGQKPMIGLPEGRTCFVPFGIVPVVIGIGLDAGPGYLAYVSNFILDVQVIHSVGNRVRAEISGALLKSVANNGYVWQKGTNKTSIEDYVKLWADITAPTLEGVENDH
jgi:hypothetical protein